MEYISCSDILIPKLGFGTFAIPIECLKFLIPKALQLGYGLFDTAAKYNNEEAIGTAIHGSNSYNCLIESKINSELLKGNLRYLRLNKKSIKTCYKKSCERIGIPQLDIYLLHSVFDGYEKQFMKLKKMKDDGLVKIIGICNVTLEQLIQLNLKTGVHPDIVQVEVHPYFCNKQLLDYCKKNRIAIESRSPFAHGDAMNKWKKEHVLVEIAKAHECTIPQVILRWLTQQDIVALPRTTSVEHLKENIESFNLSLTPVEMAKIDSLDKNMSFGFISTKKINL